MINIDQIAEQIAFGAEAQKPSSSLGLYLGPDVIYLSETHLSGSKLVVDHMVRIPIPAAADAKNPSATATMNTDFLADPVKIAGLIRQSMSQLRWKSKNVRVTLSHHLGLLRYFAMPALERRFLRSAVPIEAKKYIPIPFDMLAHDFQATRLPPDAAGKQRTGVLIAVTQKKNIANVQGLMNVLGLKLTGLEVAPCSVLRLWQTADAQKNPAPFAHVHIDGGSVRIMVVDRGIPVFFREVFLSQDADVTDTRKIDLSGCLAFVQKQLGLGGVSRLRVSGNLANLAAIKDALAAETGLETSIQDTPKLLSVKSGDWGGYASLGASAYSLAPVATLDLAASDRVTDEERRTARDILIAGAAAALFFMGSGLLKSATYTYRARELHQYQRSLDPDVAQSLKGMDASSIDKMLGDMQSQLDQLHAVTAGGRHLKISAVLKEIIDAMPEKLWLEKIAVSNPIQADDKMPFDVVLGGHVQDKTVKDEQNMAFQFKETLVRNPRLGKDFEITLSLHKVSNGTDSEGNEQPGLDPKMLAERLEKRTQFELELKAKH
jgi:hypothetical protein